MRARLSSAVMAIVLAATASADVSLSVMTFNVRYGTAKDGENSWKHRRDVVVKTIRKYDPDVFGTQECLDFQAEYITGKLPEYRWFGVGREKDGTGEMMAVFYRHSVVNPMELGNFWLSETPEVPGSKSWDTACTRMVTWARFYHHKSESAFYLFNTHFDHRSEAARVGAAHLLPKRLNLLAGDAPAIVTGDFNAAAEKSEPWKVMTQGGLSDAWLAAKKQVGCTMTFGGYNAPKPEGGNRIDWILTQGPITVESCETVLYNEDGRYPSDHYPVFAKVKVGE